MRILNGALKVATLSGLLALLSTGDVQGQNPPRAPMASESQTAGRQVFATRCASCHGTTANGGEFAPSIGDRVPLRKDDELARLLHDGLSSGMPAFPDLIDQERTNLIGFLRTLQPSHGAAMASASVRLQDGKMLQGIALN